MLLELALKSIQRKEFNFPHGLILVFVFKHQLRSKQHRLQLIIAYLYPLHVHAHKKSSALVSIIDRLPCLCFWLMKLHQLHQQTWLGGFYIVTLCKHGRHLSLPPSQLGSPPSPIQLGLAMEWPLSWHRIANPPQLVALARFLESWTGGVVRQLAVELDTYMNEFDPDANHIGIDTTSIAIPIAAKSLSGTGVDLKSGREVKVKIDYDGWRETLHISVGYAGNPLLSFLNHSIALSDTVPSSVYVGFTGSTGTVSETHQVLDWAFTSIPITCSSSKCSGNDKTKTILIIVFPVTVAMLVLVMCGILSVLRVVKRRNGRIDREDFESRSRSAANVPKMFTYKQLSKATHNFSKENLLGAGGFGTVYKGILSDHPSPIAVKKISATSKQGEREYLAEICTIGRLRHKNIVQLQGWCHEGKHLLLVYEYMSNGSLDRFIGRCFLDWKTRSRGITEETSLVDYVWILHGKDALLQCVDSMLKGEFDEEQVKRTLVVGLACLHPDFMLRPRMRKVIQILLNPNEPLMDLPEARPSGIFVPVPSSAATVTDFGSFAASASYSNGKMADETEVQYGL
ncbi:unnamed protein product, partial [Vitis vinifera]